MCVVSNVMGHYRDRWWPTAPVGPYEPFKPTYPDNVIDVFKPKSPAPKPEDGLTQEEINELRELIKKAKQYDNENNEQDCESDQKKAALKEMAKMWGFEIDFL